MSKLKDYFKGDDLAASVWKGKYALPNEETPNDMHRRTAKEFARIEINYAESEVVKESLSKYGKSRKPLNEESIYNLFKDFKYLVPQGRVMAGLGVLDSYRSLSNCLRLPPPKDAYSSIMYTDTMLVSSAKRGCGYGLGISGLRPAGSFVSNAANSSTGAASFMERFSFSTREVAQQGRRGACLLDIDIRHPDVFEFINAKKDRTKITGANISTKNWDDFMEAVKKDEDYLLRFPCTKEFEAEYPTTFEYGVLTDIKHGDGTVTQVKRIRAKELYNQIIENAWENAEPGQFFWDRMIDYDPSSVYSRYFIDGTNACGEQPMAVYDTCRLLCHNLYSYILNPFSEGSEVDYDKLYQYSYELMRIGDDLVDLEVEYVERIIDKINSDDLPVEEKAIELKLWKNVRDIAKFGRRVGCGITALGDMLAALNLKYDSEEALLVTEKVMKTKMQAELDCSIDLAILRGKFKDCDPGLEFEKTNDDIKGKNSFYQMLVQEFPEQVERLLKYGRRNVNWSTIAPTGSVSVLTQTTSGCEPLFMPYYMRRKKINPADKESRVDFTDQNGDQWQEYPVLHPKFINWWKKKCWENDDYEHKGTLVDAKYSLERMSKDELLEVFEKSPWYDATANDIDWIKRVEMQSILQKYTTSAISSTINLPNNVTKEEVAEIYIKAWEMGLKGVTVYRDGCRTGVLVSEQTKFEQRNAPKRPASLPADIHTTTSKGKKYNVIVGLFENKPYEVFAVPYFTDIKFAELVKKGSGKYDLVKGSVVRSNVLEPMSDTEEITTRLISTSLRHGAEIKFIVEQLSKTSGDITAFSKAIARALKKYVGTQPAKKQEFEDCEAPSECSLVYEESCLKCLTCGKSKC